MNKVKRWGIGCGGILAILCIIGLINGSPDKADNNSPTGLATQPATTTPKPAKPAAPTPDPFAARVSKPPAAYMNDIRSGVIKEASLSPTGYMVKATGYDNVFLVAGKLTGAGMGNGEWGIWAVGGGDGTPNGHSLILAADGIAHQFSSFPNGKDTKADIGADDDDVQALQAYVRDK